MSQFMGVVSILLAKNTLDLKVFYTSVLVVFFSSLVDLDYILCSASYNNEIRISHQADQVKYSL